MSPLPVNAKILVANPFGIGDVLFSLPLVRALKHSYPNGSIAYLCNRRTEELVRAWPEIRACYVFEKDEFRRSLKQSKKKGLGELLRFLRRIRGERFDLFMDLSLGWHYGLAGLLCGIPKRVGFDLRKRGRFLTNRYPIVGFHDQPVADYHLELLSFLDLPKPTSIDCHWELPPQAHIEAEAVLKELGILSGALLVGLVPGGGASWGDKRFYKQWLPERFAKVADEITRRWSAQILLLGDASETDLCQRVRQMMQVPSAAHRVRVPSLLGLAGILKRCFFLLGNDSGPLHLAASVGTKTISIFGPVDGSVYGPHPKGFPMASHRVVSKGLACQPCYQGFRFPPCPWDNACLKHLMEEEVIQAIESLLGGSPVIQP